MQKRIRKQIDRISELVSEILEFTQGPQEELVLAQLDYGEFVTHVLDEIRPEVDIKGVRVELDGPVPKTKLRINPKRLRRVFHNLIHNATDVMPNGGPIRVRFAVTESELVTEIEDSGPGIAPEIADRLFQAFATHGKAHGTGLGLSICKKIVEDHRGTDFRAQRTRSAARFFHFSLPIQ